MGTESGSQATILFVDDSRLMRFAARKALSAEYTVLLAEDGDAALAVLAEHPEVRAVITDLMMPGVDGFELVSRIRNAEHPTIRDLPVMAVSGSAGPIERKRVRAAGADDLMTKPFRDDALRLRVERLLHGRPARVAASTPVEVPAAPNVERTRAGFIGRMRQALSLHARHDLPLAILQIRLSNAESLDAELGAGGRDAVMRLLESVLARTVRVEDTVGRTGSDHFMLLLPATTAAGARALRFRLRDALETQRFEVRGRTPDVALEFFVHLPKKNLDAAALMRADRPAGRPDNVVLLAAGSSA
ncbi:response regulator [Wenzhouxiangella sp. XN79A]|uniref:GGDEF domain-containing response regulator n=1 Tax=Wenzhouxiangella sp. XN79A TaxID=2724193 RepID=UPI00144A8842|nr:response regulator [Wenzhouxiangella sp. XN79A]NKI33987.1 response regulator [Wenzhouxiangella sp. XN79A]